MKKLTERYKKWLVRRARGESWRRKRKQTRHNVKYKRVVTAWFGDRTEDVLCVREPRTPPPIICLQKNPQATLSFFDEWRSKMAIKSSTSTLHRYGWVETPRRNGRIKKINGYMDYSSIEFISTASALIIAAEYDRAARIIGDVPPTIDLDHWSEQVFSKLYELGFFEIVGLSQRVGELYQDSGDVRTMKIVSGTNAADLQRTSEQLIDLSKFIDVEGPLNEDVVSALNSALSEAMVNVSRHAYPGDYPFKYRHVESWWVTASAHRLDGRLTIVMYDQGASIPITLPKKKWTQAIRDFVLRNLTPHKEFEYQDDAAYIQGAMRRGETHTGEPGRGEGLPQMMELIDICGSGSLTIWSRGGFCRYQPGKRLVRDSYPWSVGGTLIEWVIDLPRMENHG